MTEPNVLLLDEPTNDLDTDTLAAVEDILDSFPGTLVVVSHDRYLLERVTDHQVALLGDGSVRDLPGGVEQYLELRREAMRPSRGAADSVDSPTTPADAGPRAERGATSGARRHEARKALARIERKMERSSQAVAALHVRMEEVSADPARVGELAELGRGHLLQPSQQVLGNAHAHGGVVDASVQDERARLGDVQDIGEQITQFEHINATLAHELNEEIVVALSLGDVQDVVEE